MNKVDLNGKKILFIAPKFFGYEKHILEAMKTLGATVYYRSDKPSENSWAKMLLRLFPKLVWIIADRIYTKWVIGLELQDCDVIFIVKGEAISPAFLEFLRKRYIHAKFVFYMWDSIANVQHTEDKFALFDSISSFDPLDCKLFPNIRYRPLFFIDHYQQEAHEQSDPGLFFFGTLNGDRPKVLARVVGALDKDVRFDYGLFVRSKLELYLRRLIDSSFKVIEPNRLMFAAIPASEIKRRMSSCNCVLDVEHPNQSGLTMRTFEVLASGKKLITTNQSIRNEPFFDASNICVIDRTRPVISKDFVFMPFKPMQASFFENYSLVGWLKEVLRDC